MARVRKRRLICVLFITTMFFGFLWLCVGLLQADNLAGMDTLLSLDDRRGNVEVRRQRSFTSSSVDFAGKNFLPAEGKSSVAPHMQNYARNTIDGSRIDLSQVVLSQPEARERINSSFQEKNSTVLRAYVLDLMERNMKAQLRVGKSMQELWWYVRAKLNDIMADNSLSDDLRTQFSVFLANIGEQYRVLTSHMKQAEKISDVFQKTQVSRNLGELVQRRLHHLQNPSDCSKAKKLVCNLSKSCGFGCQIHHVTYCFIMAYATERTLLLTSRGWQYASGGWESVFMPISETCTTEDIKGAIIWKANVSTIQTVSLPTIEGISTRPPQLPQSVPKDLAKSLVTFHGYPFVWFAGQFVKYLLRPNPELKKYIETKKEELAFKRPIVGVHIRRTDKLKSEAKFHSIEEYMDQVEEWYEDSGMERETQRRVYVATDDPKVLTEARGQYPSYEIIGDWNISHLASVTKTRYSKDSLYGLVLDVLALADCDYIVCTFSSQVCRLAYELMQTYHVDASRKYYSLDDIYYFGGQQQHNVRAIQSHTARDSSEISFEVGDSISIAGNEKNGLSVGRHVVTGKKGTFPSYKVEEVMVEEDFPTYPQVL